MIPDSNVKRKSYTASYTFGMMLKEDDKRGFDAVPVPDQVIHMVKNHSYCKVLMFSRITCATLFYNVTRHNITYGDKSALRTRFPGLRSHTYQITGYYDGNNIMIDKEQPECSKYA